MIDLQAKLVEQEAKAARLHARSQKASNNLAHWVLRFRALWAEEAARLLRQRQG